MKEKEYYRYIYQDGRDYDHRVPDVFKVKIEDLLSLSISIPGGTRVVLIERNHKQEEGGTPKSLVLPDTVEYCQLSFWQAPLDWLCLNEGLLSLKIMGNIGSYLDTLALPKGLKFLGVIGNHSNPLQGVNLPEELLGLDISGNSIKSFNTDSLPVGLQFLDICANEIDSLEGIDLTTFVNLQELDISYNPLLSVDSLGALAQLEVLIIQSSDINSLLPVAFDNLRDLDISSTCLRSLDSLSLLPQLEILKAAKNEIADLPLGGFDNLRDLDLQFNHLTRSAMGALKYMAPSLISLNVSRNKISSLDELRLPVWLEEFRADFCQINSARAIWPGTIKIISLQNNAIKEFNCRNLSGSMELLHLGGNEGLVIIDLSYLMEVSSDLKVVKPSWDIESGGSSIAPSAPRKADISYYGVVTEDSGEKGASFVMAPSIADNQFNLSVAIEPNPYGEYDLSVAGVVPESDMPE